jgi:hypothetical protein
MTFKKLSIIMLFVILSLSFANGGFFAYEICQSGCNAVAVACSGARGILPHMNH